MDNSVTLTGDVTRAPEVRFTQSGTPVAGFGLAVNRYRGPDKESEVSFFDVTVWQEQAENVMSSLDKGDRVVVTGRLEQQNWEAEDGTKRSTIKVIAHEVGPSLRWAECKPVRNEKKGVRSGDKNTNNDPFVGSADDDF